MTNVISKIHGTVSVMEVTEAHSRVLDSTCVQESIGCMCL
jgi:hypothetical protein